MSDFETYIINLKKDIHIYYNLKDILNNMGIYPHRFDAIYGKMIKDYNKYNEFITTYCKYLCPKGLIGCGLSHYTLLNNIHNGDLKGNTNDFTLVLEDDVIPLFEDKDEIIEIIDYAPNDCDLLMLHCLGRCPYDDDNRTLYLKPTSRFIGSAAAYLIRNSAIPKLLKTKLFFHVDMQFYNTILDNVYVYYKPMFRTDDSSSNINESNYATKGYEELSYHFPLKVHNITTERILTYPLVRIPMVDVTVNTFNIIQVVIVITILIFIYYIMVTLKHKKNT